MKILIVMDPGILVPPVGYGGHERLVALFAEQYLKLGHEVHLLVTEGSHIEGCVVHSIGKAGFPARKSEMNKALFKAWKFLWINRNRFDLIHNFGRLLYLLPVLASQVKKIMTYGREIDSKNIHFINKFPHKNLVFTGCSTDLISRGGSHGRWATVYNSIDFSKYTLVSDLPEDSPLMFLGRIEKVKGCHHAIDVARKTGRKLIIAGNISPLEHEKQYYETEIKPFIDGANILHIGTVNDEQKNHYLGKSAALLFPIDWNEPFGIVMIEAMACGTPVIAFTRGSVNEVVEDGVTGFKVNDKAGMIDAVAKLKTIDRTGCRAEAERRFDVKVIADQYLSLL